MSEAELEAVQVSEEEPLDSAMTTFFNVFFGPTAAFKSLARKPRWLIPILFSILVVIASQFLAIERIGSRNLAEKQFAVIEQFGIDIPDDRRAQIIDDIESRMKYTPINVLIFMFVGLGVLSGLLYVAVMAMGGSVRFYTTFASVVHAMGAYFVLVSLLSMVVLVISPEPEELDIQNLVAANPSFLVDARKSPGLFTVLNSLDLTSFYLIFLLALGLSTVARGVSMGMGVGIVGLFWALWVLIKMIPSLIFS